MVAATKQDFICYPVVSAYKTEGVLYMLLTYPVARATKQLWNSGPPPAKRSLPTCNYLSVQLHNLKLTTLLRKLKK